MKVLCGDIEHSKGGVFISEANKKIYGIDCSNLILLYDLIKADIVEVGWKNESNMPYRKTY